MNKIDNVVVFIERARKVSFILLLFYYLFFGINIRIVLTTISTSVFLMKPDDIGVYLFLGILSLEVIVKFYSWLVKKGFKL
jgi:hypothetical protein